jgi:hypothetical protein
MQGYRTYIAALLAAIFGILAQTNWVEIIANPKAGLVALGMALLMAVMRTITTTPGAIQVVFNKPDTTTDQVQLVETKK